MKNQNKGLCGSVAASVMTLVLGLSAACGQADNKNIKHENIYSVILKDAAADNMTAVPQKASEGTEVRLRVNENKGYILTLTAGDLLLTRVNPGEWTFIMPAANVEVEAAFSATPSEDASLSALSASTGAWDTNFKPEVTTYEIEVESHVTSITFNYMAAFIDAGVTGTETLAISGDSAQAEFMVTAQNSSVKKTYSVVVFKMPNPVLEKVSISGTGSGYTLPAFDTVITSALIAPMIPFAQGKNSIPIIYTAVFSPRNTDNGVALTFNGGSDFSFTGKTAAITLNLGASKSGTFEVRASKTIAGKERVSTKTYTLTLERSDSTTYPQASESMADGGQVVTIKKGAGAYEIAHLFFYDPQNSENGQTEGIFTVNVPVKNAQVLVLAGGGAGGIGTSYSTWFGAGGGAGGLSYQQNVNLDPGEITVKVGAGGAGTAGNRGQSGFASIFGDGVSVAGGGGGAAGATGKLSSGANGGSGGGGSGDKKGGIAVDPAYGSNGGDGTGYSASSGGRSYGGGGGGAGGAGQKAAQADHSGALSRGGIGKTWDELDNIVTPAMLSVPGTLYGLAGGGNGVRSSTDRLIDEGPGYGGGLGYLFTANPDHNGIANTGGGGGAGNGAGASGIVIIRYAYIQPIDR